jgi:hypothetical protein
MDEAGVSDVNARKIVRKRETGKISGSLLVSSG